MIDKFEGVLEQSERLKLSERINNLESRIVALEDERFFKIVKEENTKITENSTYAPLADITILHKAYKDVCKKANYLEDKLQDAEMMFFKLSQENEKLVAENKTNAIAYRNLGLEHIELRNLFLDLYSLINSYECDLVLEKDKDWSKILKKMHELKLFQE